MRINTSLLKSCPNNSLCFLFIPIALFLVLAISRAAVWEPTHDEGVTFNQAIGPINLTSEPESPLPFQKINSILDGEDNYSWTDVVKALDKWGMHPPFYYLFINLWAKLFGTFPIWLRMPGIIVGLMSIIGIWLLMDLMIFDRWAKLWSAILLAASLQFIHFSILLRPYGLAICLAIWSSYVLLSIPGIASNRNEGRLWGAYLGLSLLGIYTIYHYAFVLVWQFSFFLLSALFISKESRLKFLAKIVGAGLLIIVGFLPWIPFLITDLKGTKGAYYFGGFMSMEEWPTELAVWGWNFFLQSIPAGRFGLTLFWVLALVSSAVFVKVLFWNNASRISRKTLVFWTSVPVLPASIVFADYWHNTHTFFIMRTMFPMVPLIVLALVFCFMSVPRKPTTNIGLVLWLAISLTGSIGYLYKATSNTTDYQQLTNYFLENDRDSHIVVLSSQARGYVHPLFLLLRDSGIQKLRFARGSDAEIPEMIERLVSFPGV
jgi:uncharacterized membrane protein